MNLNSAFPIVCNDISRGCFGGSKHRFASLFACVVFLLSPAIGFSQQIQWHPDLASATQAASENNKLILMHFTAEWCKPCRHLETFVFASPQVQRAFAQNVAAVKIDVDKFPQLVNEYGVSGVPFDVAITPGGRVVSKRKCPTDTNTYVKMIAGLHTFIRAIDENGSPALAELKEAIDAQTPSPIGHPNSFTPQSPTHQAPRPSNSSAELKRKSGYVANPYIQQETPDSVAEPQRVVNAFAPTQESGAPTIQKVAANHASPEKTAPVQRPAMRQGFITNPTIAQKTVSDREVDSIPQRHSNTFVPPGNSLKSGKSEKTGALVVNQFQPAVAEETAQAPTALVPSQVQDQADSNQLQLTTQPGNHQQPAGDNQFSSTVSPDNSATKINSLESVEAKPSFVNQHTSALAMNLDEPSQQSISDEILTTDNTPSHSAGGNDFLPPKPPAFVDSADPTPFKAPKSAELKSAELSPGVSGNNGFVAPKATDDLRLTAKQPTPNQPSVATTRATYALHGKCPVTLLTESKWVDGDPSWGCVHRNRVYIFANEQQLKTFQSDPDAHSPILAGFDPVLYAETGKLIDGLESHGVFMGRAPHQRIVLFANAENRSKFQAIPKKYLEAVRQAMKKTGASSKLMR